MRLIDVDALIEEWHENPPSYDMDRVFAALAQAPIISGWISVKDKVPDNQRPVIVYVPPHVDETKGASLGYVGMAYYTSLGKGFWCGTDGNMYGAIGIIYPPTHWMEPPEEVSEDA